MPSRRETRTCWTRSFEVVETKKPRCQHVRVTTAFNRILALPGASVSSVEFGPGAVVVGIRRRSHKLRCPCGQISRVGYDVRQRSWRHLDLASTKLVLRGEVRRLWCSSCCRIVTEEVPWARPGARHSRDFEDVVTWLCQRADKTTASRLLRCSWRAVDAIVNRVVADHIDDSRLDDLYRIGVDEIAYKRGHNYLTIVADHDTGNVVWVDETKSGAALERFFDAMGPERTARIEAVSMDFGTSYRDAVRRRVPDAAICFDPFHLVQMANRALDSVYMSSRKGVEQVIAGRDWRRARAALRYGAERLSDSQAELVARLGRNRRQLGRAWELKEMLRDLYRVVEPADSRLFLKSWVTAALRSRIPAFRSLARRIRHNFEGIVAAVELGLANTRLEGINGHIRVIQRRSHGLTSPRSLASMIYLCLGGIAIELPT